MGEKEKRLQRLGSVGAAIEETEVAVVGMMINTHIAWGFRGLRATDSSRVGKH
ncbi:hypothetical protein U1Q18_024172, partial [Sarracenia purpurea var. burkii]